MTAIFYKNPFSLAFSKKNIDIIAYERCSSQNLLYYDI